MNKEEAETEQELFKDAIKRAYEFLRGGEDFDEGRIVMGMMQTLLDSIEEYHEEAEKGLIDLLTDRAQQNGRNES